MRRNRVGCLPVLDDGRLVGIVTSYDFLDASARLFKERLTVKSESLTDNSISSKESEPCATEHLRATDRTSEWQQDLKSNYRTRSEHSEVTIANFHCSTLLVVPEVHPLRVLPA